MHLDVVELKAFYASHLGGIVRRILANRIRARWRRANGLVVMGIGFASPYLGSYRGEATRLAVLMPASQGALVWPANGPAQAVLVDEEQLPLPDNSVDRMLAVHCLEVSEGARPLLRELWRVLAPEGRILLVVPNRMGLWARREATPFGHGQPYSRAQLDRLLHDALFTPLEWSTALHMPPINHRWLVRWATAFERMGARFWPGFAGVLMVEAQKQTTAPIGRAEVVRRAGRMVPVSGNGVRRDAPDSQLSDVSHRSA